MRRLAALVLAGSVFLLGVQQAPAWAQQRRRHRHPRPTSVIEIGDQAPLSADGRTADITITMWCKATTPMSIKVTAKQNRTTGTAAVSDIVCNAQRQRHVVPVNAGSGQFQQGSALVTVAVELTTGGQRFITRTVQLT